MDEILTRVNVFVQRKCGAIKRNIPKQPQPTDHTIQTSIHTYTTTHMRTNKQTNKQTNQNIKLCAYIHNKRGELNNLINWFRSIHYWRVFCFVLLCFALLAISAHFHYECRFKGPPHTHTRNIQNWLNLKFGFYSCMLWKGNCHEFSIELKTGAKFGWAVSQ